MPKNTGPIFGFDVQALAVALAPVLAAELAKVLPEVCSQLARHQGQALSVSGARRMAKCRRATLAAALESGALKGWRNGTRWVITVGDVADWIKAGRLERK